MIHGAVSSVTVVAGRYRLIRVIGEGGMSRVWLARDEVLGRDVAAKEMIGSSDTWARTVREAQAAARLAHPNVVRVYDVLNVGQRPWIVMEYLPSRSLDAVVAAGGPMSPAQAATVGIAVLDGLVAAHRAGVLHRDVKPQNVLVAADGRVLLGDFGVAAFDDAGEITRERTPLASPLFVAPERVRDGTSTAHTDLWSFGATLYWTVEGRPPYARATMAEQLSAVQREAPDPMRRAGPLAPVIEGLLVHEPAQRLTATIVRQMLSEVADGSVIEIVEPPTQPVVMGRASLLQSINQVEHALTPEPPAAVPVRSAPVAAFARTVSLPLLRGRNGFRERFGHYFGKVVAKVEGDPTREMTTAHLRTRRKAAAVTLAAALLAAAVVAAFAVRGQPSMAGQFMPAPSASPTIASPTLAAVVLGCDLSGAASPATVIAGAPGRTLLQEGWVWQDEDAGFRIGVPAGWLRAAIDTEACYVDTAGQHRLTVQSGASIDPDRVGAWMDAEQKLLADDPPESYQRVNIGPVDFRAGGADWEYTYEASGSRWHVLCRAFAVDALRAYVMTWTTTDADWDDAQPDFRAAATSFDAGTS
jgi:hypothetical protein